LAAWKLLWCIFTASRDITVLFSDLPCLGTLLEGTKHTNKKLIHRRVAVQQAASAHNKSVIIKV